KTFPPNTSNNPERRILWGLEHDVSVGQNHRRPPPVDAFHDSDRVREKSLFKWILHQEVRHGQQVRVIAELDSISLQRAKVVGMPNSARNISKISQYRFARSAPTSDSRCCRRSAVTRS